MTDWAEDNDLSLPFVSAILAGTKEPSERMCELLGYRKIKEPYYVKETTY